MRVLIISARTLTPQKGRSKDDPKTDLKTMNRNMKTKNDKRECECYAPGNYECPCIKCSGNSMCHQFRLCQHCQPSEEKQMKIDIDCGS